MVLVDNNTYHIYSRDEPEVKGGDVTWELKMDLSNKKFPGML